MDKVARIIDNVARITDDVVSIILLLCLPYRLFKLLLGDYCEAEIIKRRGDRLIYQAVIQNVRKRETGDNT